MGGGLRFLGGEVEAQFGDICFIELEFVEVFFGR